MMFEPYTNPKIPIRPRAEDPEDVRLGAFVRAPHSPLADVLPEIREQDFVLLGYPDDRGVDRNGGRLGAADGPDTIRKALYNMTPDALAPKGGKDFVIWDLGNLRSWSMNLTEAHEEARKAVQKIRETGAKLITLGGGHDWAFPDFVDFTGRLLNVDAHLDMRPLLGEGSDSAVHSGSPFRKILSVHPDGSRFGVIGVQKHCNARSHLEFAKGHRVSVAFLEELPWALDKQWTFLTERFSLDVASERFSLSIDLDAFPQSVAPGVSAPQPFGLDPQIVLRLIDHLNPRLKHLGIYELNPLFDRDAETSRLAAKLIYRFISQGN